MGSAQIQKTGAAQEWQKNWVVVLASGLGFALSTVTVYSVGPFIAPLEAEFGWSRAQISSGLTVYALIGMILAPLVGIAIDRYGAKRIGVGGVFAYCIAFGALALATPSIAIWLALWVFLSFASSAIKPTVWTTGVSSLFDSGRGLAISLMLCGSTLGSSVTPIMATWLIDNYGWRTAYFGLACFYLVLICPLVMIYFTSARDKQRVAGDLESAADKAAAMAQLTGLTWREGIFSWKFLRLAGATVVTVLAVISFISNIVPILSDSGISRAQAAGVAALVGLSTIVGRLTGGYLLDRINGGIVGGVCLLMPVIGFALVLANPGSIEYATAAVLIIGLSLGAELDCVAYLATRHFGMRNFGVIFGTISGLLAMSTGVGPFLVNLSYDITGGYDLALQAFIPMSLLASALFFSLGRYPVFDTVSSAGADAIEMEARL